MPRFNRLGFQVVSCGDTVLHKTSWARIGANAAATHVTNSVLSNKLVPLVARKEHSKRKYQSLQFKTSLKLRIHAASNTHQRLLGAERPTTPPLLDGSVTGSQLGLDPQKRCFLRTYIGPRLSGWALRQCRCWSCARHVSSARCGANARQGEPA